MTNPTVICVTPVKNEAWILPRFLACASLWADHIIVLDQNSDDGSAQIALEYPKVRLVQNQNQQYDEPDMRARLFEEARRIPGPRLLIGLDADEAITANVFKSLEWDTVLNSQAGTVIAMHLANLMPDLQRCWVPNGQIVCGFMDDGSPYEGGKIHTPRMPVPDQAPRMVLKDLKLLHYQYTDWARMRSKHRWYQCWETLNMPEPRPYGVYRTYHHMNAIKPEDYRPIPSEWFQEYIERDIDMTSTRKDPEYRWDREVAEYFQEYGTKRFSKLDIWDNDWKAVGRRHGYEKAEEFKDPRGILEKMMHRWLRRTQAHQFKLQHRIIDALLRRLPGW